MKRRKKAGPCIMGTVHRGRRGRIYVKFPRGCAGFRCFSRSMICAACTRRVNRYKREAGL